MARFLGSVRCKSGWVMALVELRRDRRTIEIDLVPFEELLTRRARWIALTPDAPQMPRRALFLIDPELCFAALQGGRRVAAARRTVLGRKERWALLQEAYPGLPVPRRPAGASDADLLDALVLAWAAQEISAGRAPGRFRLV